MELQSLLIFYDLNSTTTITIVSDLRCFINNKKYFKIKNTYIRMYEPCILNAIKYIYLNLKFSKDERVLWIIF